MPHDGQSIFDLTVIQESFNSLTDSVEQQFDFAARSLQDAFRDSPWLPESIRPKTPPSPSFDEPLRHSLGYLERTRYWISEHRAVTAAVVAFIGTGVFIVWKHRKADRAKRRAKRSKNGSKTEVVILAGSPHSPLTKSLSLDLERRGFIVYIPTASLAEEQAIQQDARKDIKAMNIDVSSAISTEEAVKKLNDLLSTSSPQSSTDSLHLAAYIHLPPPSYQTGAIINIGSLEWSDILNNDLLAPFTSLHAFLPLLSSQQSNLLFLTPNIGSSLSSPSHAPENVVVGALERYISTLRRELSSVNVVQLKLGLFNYGHFADERKQVILAQNPPSSALSESKREERLGSPLRTLHNNVFDCIVRGKARNGTVFVGQGSRVYDLVGTWMPLSLVNLMVNLRDSKDPVLVRRASEDSLDGSSWEKFHESSN